MTNLPRVGQELCGLGRGQVVVAENTIETHLRSVFRKLEIGSRSQLARVL